MQYILNTKYMTLMLEPNEYPSWWVDSSYAVHLDMPSHSGIIMSLGKGATYSTSCKQKLNTKSFTEAELVAIDDALAQIPGTRHFLTVQVMFILATTIYQDNKSTMLLAKNGKIIKQQMHVTLKYRIFFHNRQDQERRSESGILSDA